MGAVATCLDCEENIELDDDADVNDLFECPKCKAKLEILDLDPVVVDYGVEEDFEE
jgi:transcription initiation factor IIE alpha subunit